ncbi:MAG: dockerin type I repeat-containing protein, partial [candidate division Zixibacteria bacterium]|nr:dockerin type I repeat-containing protein [candidate division Zixibacteria bacterium]
NDKDTYEKNDNDAEIFNSEYVSWVNAPFSKDNFNGNIKFTVLNDSDKMVVFANINIGAVNAREIFVELDYTTPYTISSDRPVSVVKLSDTAYDIRWEDAALGWIGTMVYGVENVEKITDTGSELRVYLLDDTTGHNNENFNITLYLWNHEGIKNVSDITDLHTRAPVYYNQHFIKINKNDDRFGILEFGESAIINESYTDNKVLSMQLWGLRSTQQDYTFYYNTLNDIENVTVDGVETVWDYDSSSNILTFSVDYSDEVREIIITENSIQPLLPCGDLNHDESVTLSDIVYFINYLFRGGKPPQCEPYTICADVNKDNQITISDIIYLINYWLK